MKSEKSAVKCCEMSEQEKKPLSAATYLIALFVNVRNHKLYFAQTIKAYIPVRPQQLVINKLNCGLY